MALKIVKAYPRALEVLIDGETSVLFKIGPGRVGWFYRVKTSNVVKGSQWTGPFASQQIAENKAFRYYVYNRVIA